MAPEHRRSHRHHLYRGMGFRRRARRASVFTARQSRASAHARSGHWRRHSPLRHDRVTLQQRLRAELKRAGDPARAAQMQAYMKSAMPYFGVSAVPLRAITKRIFDAHRLPDAETWQRESLAIFRGARHREEWYAAVELTGHRFYREYQTRAALPMYEDMIVTGAWWDIVDTIASRRLGPLLRAEPRFMRRKMLDWSRSRDMWKRRSSIICQLGFKRDTDLELLYACIEP